MITYTDIFLWAGIPMMLYGYKFEAYKHETRVIGYILLGVFWVFQAPYFFSLSDYVNAFLCLIALPLFLYLAYNEYLSKKWEEDPKVMLFLAGGISIAMLIYYGIQRVPILSGALIKVVTDHTVIVSNLLGYEFTSGSINYVGNPLFYRVNNENIFVSADGSGINIILACTALQTLAPAGSLIYCTVAPNIKKIKALLLVLPSIYIANIGRNVLVIYLTIENITSFEVAHNEVSKTGSVIVLIILLLAVFEILPEFHDNIMSLLKLPWREPNHQKQLK